MSDRASLRLTFHSGRGESYTMVVPLDEEVASNIERIRPLGPYSLAEFEEVVEVLRTRQFRKDLFVQQASNLGLLLAERMEDAEGWHDQSRVEPARRTLKGESV